jgi:pimeloyl-ACP methyl ester carboxylesterase
MRTLLLLFAAAAFGQESVTFLTPDGITLHADRYGSGRRAVVLVHGGRFTKESWKEQSETLARNGFTALAIDFRGYGQTIPGTQKGDWKPYPDVLAAVRSLHAQGAESVDLVGASMGGDAAGDAAVQCRPGELRKIVFLAAQGADQPKLMKGAKLFILSRGDGNGAGPRLPGIQAAYDATPGPKEFVVLEDGARAVSVRNRSGSTIDGGDSAVPVATIAARDSSAA